MNRQTLSEEKYSLNHQKICDHTVTSTHIDESTAPADPHHNGVAFEIKPSIDNGLKRVISIKATMPLEVHDVGVRVWAILHLHCIIVYVWL